jgi:hypothetical protein
MIVLVLSIIFTFLFFIPLQHSMVVTYSFPGPVSRAHASRSGWLCGKIWISQDLGSLKQTRARVAKMCQKILWQPKAHPPVPHPTGRPLKSADGECTPKPSTRRLRARSFTWRKIEGRVWNKPGIHFFLGSSGCRLAPKFYPMPISIPLNLQAEVNKCLSMIASCSTQAHFRSTSTYLTLWVHARARKLSSPTEFVLLEAVSDLLWERMRSEVKKRNLPGWEISGL